MKISVTQRDIDRGRKSDCRYCPIAWAATRAFNEQGIDVQPSYIFRHGRSVKHWMPEEAQLFIEAFDNGEPVSPFEFEVTV